MKTKLRLLFAVGIIVLFSPILYFSALIKTVLSLICGIVILYLTWRIHAQYKHTLLKVRRYEESPIIE